MRNTHLLAGNYTRLEESDRYQRTTVSAIIQRDG
jgi:hypothetical protein